jgi:hypothetical protein
MDLLNLKKKLKPTNVILLKKRAQKEAEEMATYALEEQAAQEQANAMKDRIEKRKAELAEQRAAKEQEDLAAYMAQDDGSSQFKETN